MSSRDPGSATGHQVGRVTPFLSQRGFLAHPRLLGVCWDWISFPEGLCVMLFFGIRMGPSVQLFLTYFWSLAHCSMLVMIWSFSRCSLQGSLGADLGGKQQVFGTRRKWDSKGWEHRPVSSLLPIQASSLLPGEETPTAVRPRGQGWNGHSRIPPPAGQTEPARGDTSEQAVLM